MTPNTPDMVYKPGHDATAGLLSFLNYHLIKNPAAYAGVQAEVDLVLGTGGLAPHHLNKLQFIKACIRETLRCTYSLSFSVLVMAWPEAASHTLREASQAPFCCTFTVVPVDMQVSEQESTGQGCNDHLST